MSPVAALRSRLHLLAAVLTLASWPGAGTAAAGSLVEFPNVSDSKPALVGYLARPDTGLSALAGGGAAGAMPYPAIVVLHGSGGISSHSVGIADRLGSWGYVALAVDSLGPRGLVGGGGQGFEQAFDAYAALRYLAAQSFVDPARVAVLGQSMGGYAALYAVDRDLAAQYFTERFRAAVAYYPGCDGIGLIRATAPALILIGEADDLTPAERCREMLASARPDSAALTLKAYPGAAHAFDVVALQPGRRSLGHWMEYNEEAAKDAQDRVRAFLAADIGADAADRERGR